MLGTEILIPLSSRDSLKSSTLIPLNHREQNDGWKPVFLRVEQELKEWDVVALIVFWYTSEFSQPCSQKSMSVFSSVHMHIILCIPNDSRTCALSRFQVHLCPRMYLYLLSHRSLWGLSRLFPTLSSLQSLAPLLRKYESQYEIREVIGISAAVQAYFSITMKCGDERWENVWRGVDEVWK